MSVSVGGVAINPGDLVVGDVDGVVVVERERAESLLELAAKKVAAEAKRMEGIRQSTQMRPTWLEDALRAAGVLKPGETL
jgi:4-hydroxy-4-methyl-2-oxoglutarate aldolase